MSITSGFVHGDSNGVPVGSTSTDVAPMDRDDDQHIHSKLHLKGKRCARCGEAIHPKWSVRVTPGEMVHDICPPVFAPSVGRGRDI